MSASPLITIVTITYNAADTVGVTLQSVASQTFRDYEHIVIDGASTDGTLEVVKRYPSVGYISEKDRGLYDAMNKGLRRASGKYVLFLNAGDTFHDETVLADYARYAKEGFDIIYGDTDIVDSERRFISKRHLDAPERLTKDSFLNGMLVCHQAFMVKKEIAPEYDLKYRFSADYDWTVKCIEASEPDKCKNLHRVVIDYLNDGMTDRNKFASLKERFRIMSRHYGGIKTFTRHIGFIFRALKRGRV